MWKDLIGNVGDMHAYSGQAPKWMDNALDMDGSFYGLYADSSLPSPLQGTITINGCGFFGLGEYSAASIFSNRTAWTAGAFQYATNPNSSLIELTTNSLNVNKTGRFYLSFEGSFNAVVSSTSTVNFLNSRFYIGNIMNGSYCFRYSKIYAIRIYNHYLTADKITANNAVDKVRFNLP